MLGRLRATGGRVGRAVWARTTHRLGGATRARVILLLACVLALSSADVATVGASATQLKQGLHISNTGIGSLVTVTALVAAVASVPFGVLADRVRRVRTLGAAVALWGAAMVWSASVGNFTDLLFARLFLGVVTAAAGPVVASLIGDYFPGGERGRVYGYILAGELAGAGFGFAVSGDLALLSWRAAFVILALPAFLLAWGVLRMPEPARGGAGALLPDGEEDGESRPRARPASGAGAGASGRAAEEVQETDAQRLAEDTGGAPEQGYVPHADLSRLNLLAASAYVLRVRTNVLLIIASACGYYFLAGVETFGSEFVKEQEGINQAMANLILVLVGLGAIGGVLSGGRIGDALLARRHLTGRIIVSAVAATAACLVALPALLTRSLIALPFLMATAFALSAQNPPLDAARLDIMPPRLWGRAEAIRTLLRSLATAAAPLLFGVMSDHVFGGGRIGLQWTFVTMLAPLAAAAILLFRALTSYPSDVASAAAAAKADRRARRPSASPSR